MKRLSPILLTLLLAASLPSPVQADELRVAVAANFRQALETIAAAFEQQSPHEVVLISGSTGKHYAQIVNGAPFDLFLAADAERPERLEDEGMCVPGSRFTYARGRLVLWSPADDRIDPGGDVLRGNDFRHLAIANPKLAPYGRAARETLESLGLWEALAASLVRGENVGQAFQFVKSGNAELGLVAWSQLQQDGEETEGSWWLVPDTLHQPIEQQAVLLRPGAAAESFMAFLGSEKAVEIIRAHGYGVPDDS